jgi:hypothetical protein
MAAVSGLLFGHAWLTGERVDYWLALLVLVSGALFFISALPKSAEPRLRVFPRNSHRHFAAPDEPLLLGELLVHHYRLITEEQLETALRRQRATHHLLGEILVEMGLITNHQLRIALEFQRVHMDRWREDPTHSRAWTWRATPATKSNNEDARQDSTG